MCCMGCRMRFKVPRGRSPPDTECDGDPNAARGVVRLTPTGRPAGVCADRRTGRRIGAASARAVAIQPIQGAKESVQEWTTKLSNVILPDLPKKVF